MGNGTFDQVRGFCEVLFENLLTIFEQIKFTAHMGHLGWISNGIFRDPLLKSMGFGFFLPKNSERVFQKIRNTRDNPNLGLFFEALYVDKTLYSLNLRKIREVPKKPLNLKFLGL